MIERSFGLIFFLKQSKDAHKNDRTVYTRITINKKSKDISLMYPWSIERWDIKLSRAMGTKADAKELNAFLETIRFKVLEGRRTLMESNTEITAENLKNILLGQTDENRKLLKVFEDHNQQMEALVGKEFSEGTMERYITSLAHTRAYILWKYKKEDISILDLNYEFIADYAFWFKTQRNCAHNTTMKYLSNLKKIVLICIKKGWIPKDPFLEFKMVRKEVKREVLSKEELEMISKKVLHSVRLDQVRDIFLFSCYTGLAYVDVKNLQRSQLTIGVDGEKWIFTERKKTDTTTHIPILPQAMKLIKKYEDHPECENQGKVLPVLSNQKMNSYLKEIADLSGITKELTFHIARHTFATTITLANGVPIETVSKLLGHKSLKQTQHYAKILDNKISEDMKKLRDKMERV
jgi:site-specific recombinase XerD